MRVLPSRRRQRGFIVDPYRFATGPQDPYWANVVSLIHFDGPGGGGTTAIVDETGKTWTYGNSGGGSGQLSTAQKLFGPSSWFNDGQNAAGGGTSNFSWQESADHADWDFGNGDFTLEGWMRPESIVGSGRVIWGQANSAGYAPIFIFQNATTLQLYMTTASGSFDIVSAGTIGTLAISTATRWAVSRVGTSVHVYTDGTRNNTFSVGTSAVYNSTDPMRIGYQQTGGASFYGYLDEMRATKGVGRYSGASYTLDASPFPNS